MGKANNDNNKLMEDDIDLNEDKMKKDSLPEMKEYSGKTFTIEIVAGAILGSLSILIGFSWDALVERVGGFGPSFAPGMTWIDFLAIPILIAFLVFGIRSGLIACVIGCGAIAGYLSEGGLGWLAMLPKFVATITMFLIPWLMLKVNHRSKKKNRFRIVRSLEYSAESVGRLGHYTYLMGTAIFSRMVILFVFNLFVVLPLYGYFVFNPGEFITVFDEPLAYITLAAGYAVWNLVQGASDSIIAYLIIYPTNLVKRFATW